MEFSRIVSFCRSGPAASDNRSPIPFTRTPWLPILLMAAASGCHHDDALQDMARLPVIPLPVELEAEDGAFILGREVSVVLEPGDDPELRRMTEAWAREVRETLDVPLPVGESREGGRPPSLVIRLTGEAENAGTVPGPESARWSESAQWEVPTSIGTQPPGVEREKYELEITPESIELEAPAHPGVFYGLQTLRQLIRQGEPGSGARIPAGEIEDEPRFSYRGMHLDVGRHFFPVSFVKRYIDLLARYKMNVFHWHLTEDQGWRLEIQQYPRLTEVGSCRAETILEKNFDPYIGDGIPHCGFYTQDEAREVVDYARDRYVTVIPEIEMPGHSVAALAAYPELGCTDGPFQVATRWGVTEDIYCPREETFTFLENVLLEVMGIFPSRYIHIGGDEAPKTAWEESPLAQDVMEREGLADEEELQSWFVQRIEGFLNGNGRQLIGWDEILEGGLAPEATVMSWRGMAGGIQAAQEGHDVIMTPTGYAYFDYYQGDTLQEPLAIGGFTPLERVYDFEPVPAELSASESDHVLGAQGNVWTEYIKTPEQVEYMAFPRLLALSEVVWSPADERNWRGFQIRLARQLSILDELDVSYRIPDVSGLESDRMVLADSILLELSAPLEGGAIHYTTDGSEPGPGSPAYRGAVALEVNEMGTLVSARVVTDEGRLGPIRTARFTRGHLRRPVFLPTSRREPGLTVRAYRGPVQSVEALESGERLSLHQRSEVGETAATAARVRIPDPAPDTRFGLIMEGYLRVPRKGIYTFILSSDDGSRLEVAGDVVVDHDGLHGMSQEVGEIALHRGWHPIRIRYFQAGGGLGLRLEVEGPGLKRQEVPAHWLAHAGSSQGHSSSGLSPHVLSPDWPSSPGPSS